MVCFIKAVQIGVAVASTLNTLAMYAVSVGTGSDALAWATVACGLMSLVCWRLCD